MTDRSRRKFLKGSVLGLSGLGLGVSAIGCKESETPPSGNDACFCDVCASPIDTESETGTVDVSDEPVSPDMDAAEDPVPTEPHTSDSHDQDASTTTSPPNFIIIVADDMGYGDLTRTGHPTIRTPNLDRLADQGVTMTQFYSASSVCSPSRASLLTGRYAMRTGIVRVLKPDYEVGLPLSEVTLPSLLKEAGYRTACVGKWHLGHYDTAYYPTQRGFDSYFGLLLSNDQQYGSPPFDQIPLFEGEAIIETDCNQDTLTQRYTEKAIEFIENSAEDPFFLYLPHTMPHIPLHASDAFSGVSRAGEYGDAVEEIDWSVGQLLDTLERLGLSDNTLVVFTSDNGPWKEKEIEGGSAGLFAGGKANTWEGGVREPFIASFPRMLTPGSVCMEVGTLMDLFATVLTLAQVPLPQDRPIDGNDLLPVMQGETVSQHEGVYYFYRDLVVAVRSGSYKLHFGKWDPDDGWTVCAPPELYNVELDPSERYPVQDDFPDVVANLSSMADDFRGELADNAENTDVIEYLLAQ